ncbi:MAG: helix-turn-helix domain-containing protein [Streptosporangiales bacterium]
MADTEQARPVTVSQAWRALGLQLAASRRAAGLSQVQLAGLTPYSRSTVANVETGRQQAPRDFWASCDAALGTATALARGYDEVIAKARHEKVHAAVAARQASVITSQPGREAVLADPGSRTVPDCVPPDDRLERLRARLGGALSQGALSPVSMDAWEQAVEAHGRATKYRPPGDLLADLGADLAELEQVIRNCQSAASLRRLARVAAQLSGLVCLQLVKLDDRSGSRRWGRTARIAAGEAGDPAVMSWVLAQEAYGRYYSGDLDEAVDIARRAQALIPPGRPCVGAVLAAALEARAYAARGHAEQTRSALDRAERGLAMLDTGSVQPSAFGYTESQFRFHQENAYTRLGLIRPAWRAQDRAPEVCSPDDYTDWALIRLDRAACLAHDGDPGSGVAYATETLAGLREDQSTGIIALRGHQLMRALPPQYEKTAAVRELRELMPGPAQEDMR